MNMIKIRIESSLWVNNRGECGVSYRCTGRSLTVFDLTSSILEARFGRMVESLVELCGNMALSEGEKVGITITEDAIANLRLKGGKCLIGHLLTERWIQKEVFLLMMARLWKTMGSVVFKELHENLWLFKFTNERDKCRIKEGRS